MEFAGGLIAVFAAYWIFMAAICIALYLLSALGIKRVLEIYGYPKTWMAWIPLVQIWALADAAAEGEENWDIPLVNVKCPTIVFKLSWLIVLVLGYIPSIGGVLSIIAAVVLYGGIFQHVYSRVENRSMGQVATLAYISGIIQIIAWIKFLMYPKDVKLAVNANYSAHEGGSYTPPGSGQTQSYTGYAQAEQAPSEPEQVRATVYSAPKPDNDPFNDAPAESPFEEPNIVDAEITESKEE